MTHPEYDGLQEVILGRPHKISIPVFIKMEELSYENNCPPYHSKTNCKYWMDRHGICPYCELGSKPISDSKVDELNGNGDNVVCKKVEVVIL